MVLVRKGLHTPGSRAPGATTTCAATLYGAGGIFGHVHAGTAHVLGIFLTTVATNARSLVFRWHIFWHFSAMSALHNLEVGTIPCTAPFTIAALAAIFALGALRITGSSRRVGRAALVGGIRRSNYTLGRAPDTSAMTTLILLGALAQVGSDGHRITCAASISLALPAKAASASFLLLPLLLQFCRIDLFRRSDMLLILIFALFSSRYSGRRDMLLILIFALFSSRCSSRCFCSFHRRRHVGRLRQLGNTPELRIVGCEGHRSAQNRSKGED
mmetsp:Transcript_26230/g.42510  ORF Transcript_26230/g.42510 Transcript_26230/m.42510 type:complete len:272 (+) Transcript_26230:651-1466(+)